MTVKPSGAAATLSPWDIQTVCSAGSPAKSTPSLGHVERGCRRTRAAPVLATSPPSAWAMTWKP